jgi:hypothetical protein
MKSNSDTHLDNMFSDAIDVIANAIRAHEVVMKDYVMQYRDLRQKELVAFNHQSRHDVYRDIPKPCLLALVFRSREVSKAKHLHGYYSEEEPVQLSTIWLARISGNNTEHIPASARFGKYSAKKIIRDRNLRFQHNEQRVWTMGVVERVNDFNATSKRLRDSYLSLVDMHYNIHKITGGLREANYHLKLPAL